MGEGGVRGGDQGSAQHTRRRLTVAQAADQLGVTVDAIRSRIKRETIEHVREGGRVYVVLDADQGATIRDQDSAQHADQAREDDTPNISANQPPGPDYRDELVEELRDRVHALEEANRENRRIIAALTSRVPQLEPPQDEPQAPETASEGTDGGDVPPETQEPLERRSSWWRRFFGFE